MLQGMQPVRCWQAHLQSLYKKEEDTPANVLIKYLVPPPVQEEFVEVFKGVKDGEHSTAHLASCSYVFI